MLTRNSGASVIRLLMLVALSATLSSFLRPLGMESFKVYLNDKLLFRQYVTHDAPVQIISLNENSGNDLLTVYYDHCGRIGTNRTLTLLDGQNILKKWEYPDTQTVSASGMACSIRDIKSLEKPGRTINLMYASRELESPVLLVAISSNRTDVKANR